MWVLTSNQFSYVWYIQTRGYHPASINVSIIGAHVYCANIGPSVNGAISMMTHLEASLCSGSPFVFNKSWPVLWRTDDIVQDCCISSLSAIVIPQSSTTPLTYTSCCVWNSAPSIISLLTVCATIPHWRDIYTYTTWISHLSSVFVISDFYCYLVLKLFT